MCFLLFYAGFPTSPGYWPPSNVILCYTRATSYVRFFPITSFSLAIFLATPCFARRPQPSALPDSSTRSLVLPRLRFLPSVGVKEAHYLLLVVVDYESCKHGCNTGVTTKRPTTSQRHLKGLLLISRTTTHRSRAETTTTPSRPPLSQMPSSSLHLPYPSRMYIVAYPR
jgi:hypothetical protein